MGALKGEQTLQLQRRRSIRPHAQGERAAVTRSGVSDSEATVANGDRRRRTSQQGGRLRRRTRRGNVARFYRVGESGRDGRHGRRRLDLFHALLRGLAMRVTQAGLFGVYAGHVAGAGHSGFSHCRDLADLGINRTRIARDSQLHGQQAEQREEHCDQAMAAANEHWEIIVGSFTARCLLRLSGGSPAALGCGSEVHADCRARALQSCRPGCRHLLPQHGT